MASPIKGLALMVAKKGPALKKPAPKEEDDYGEGLEAAMSDLIAAVKKGDSSAAASAFKDAMALCE